MDSVIPTIIAITWLHFFADFIMQPEEMALNKHRSNKVLLQHCAVYAAPFSLYCILDLYVGVLFAILTGVLHFVVDYITSRVNVHLLNKRRKSLFFIGVGFDQATHTTLLLLTALWLGII